VGAGIVSSDDDRAVFQALGLGERVFSRGHRVKASFGADVTGLAWYKVRDALLEGLEGHVQLGAPVARVARDGGEFVVTTAAGEVHRARMLVGSDGYFSRVRRDLFAGGAADLVYANACSIRGVVDLDALPADVAERSRVMKWAASGGEGSPVGPGALMLRYPVSETEACWTVTVQQHLLDELGVAVPAGERLRGNPAWRDLPADDGAKKARATALVSAFAGGEDFRELEACIAGTWGSIVEGAVATLDPAAAATGPVPLHDGAAVLVGDAAHPCRPIGIGLTLGMEDAWALGSAVAEHGVGEPAAEAYAAARQLRVRSTILHSMVHAENNYRRQSLGPGEGYAVEAGGEVWTEERTGAWYREEKGKFYDGLVPLDEVEGAPGLC